MRAVVQRCLDAKVEVDNKIIGQIDNGFVVFLGIKNTDTDIDLDLLVKKICGLRIFEDENCKMNLSPKDTNAGLLVISNFTLYANTRHGFRPDFMQSMSPQGAKIFIDKFIEKCKQQNVFKTVQSGQFGADMKVSVTNDGPITIIIDTENLKWKKKKD